MNVFVLSLWETYRWGLTSFGQFIYVWACFEDFLLMICLLFILMNKIFYFRNRFGDLEFK